MKFKKLLALCMTAAMFLSAGSGALAATASGGDDEVSAVKKVSASKSTAEPRTYNEGATSGTCGDSMTWKYNESTGVLSISGSGEMTSHPWGGYAADISQVKFSGSITEICSYAFDGCKNLDTVTIPSSVVTIGKCAFENCKNLETVTFASNSNLTTLGENTGWDYGVFQGCSNLEKITIPNKVTAINSYTFYGCSNLESVVLGSGVKFIGNCAFEDCINLLSIKVPDSVESIGDYAFESCNLLSQVTLGSTLKTIGKYAFEGCNSLSSITIPASVTSIGKAAFIDLSSLKTVTFASNSNLTTLGENTGWDYGVFQGCSSLSKITLPNKLTAINSYTFYGCKNLESAVIGSSVSFIGNYAFKDCVNLKSIKVPDSVESIGDYAFESCNLLSQVTLGSSLKTIGEYAFVGCTSLTGITIPASVTSIEKAAFINLSNLKSVIFASNSNLTTLGENTGWDYGVFQGCTQLTTVLLPDKLTSIGSYCFYGCTNLTKVKIGKHVTTVYHDAFRNCSGLEKIIVPKSIISIGERAFQECSNIQKVYFTGTETNWNNLKTNYTEANNDALINAPVQYNSDINAFLDLVSISVKRNPTKMAYHVGDTLNTTGLIISLNYNDGSTKELTSGFACAPTKLDTAGTKKITVTYQGKTTSFNVTVNGTWTITTHPSNVTVHSGDNATFKVVATGTGLKYQWYYKKSGATSWSAWNGRTTASTTATANDSWNKMQVRCKVTDSSNTSLYSNAATITIAAELKITSHPSNVTVASGSNATFKVVATGTGLKYQWQYKKSGASSWSNWGSRTTASTTATANDSWNKMQVRCKVTDAAGKYVYSNAATVTIGSSALSITSHPSNVTVHAGDNATFKVAATGTGLKYQWYYKKSGATSWSAWNGRTTASTTATANDTWNKMQVRCKVTDSTGKTVYSNAATITIAAPLKITQQPKNVTASAGEDVAFIIKATGTGLKYQWYIKKSGATSWTAWNGRTAASFFSTANSTWNGMQVRCIVTDAAGTKITSNTIKITLQ